MTKTTSSPSPAAIDYDATLILAVETSNKNWVLAAHVPGLGPVKAKQTIDPSAEALAKAIEGYRRATGCGADKFNECDPGSRPRIPWRTPAIPLCQDEEGMATKKRKGRKK